MSEMKKCPFCGGEADYTQILGNYGRVYCFTCDGGIREGRSKDGVIHNWNSRPIEDALNARIAELEAAQRWIPVSERLPEDGETVFVIIHDGFERFENGNEVARLTYLGNGNWWSWESERYVVTHWMPLPQPPEVTR